jgi:hypothetical protein
MSQKTKEEIQPPHPTPQIYLIFEKRKESHLPTLIINQTSPFHATEERNPWVCPHPK